MTTLDVVRTLTDYNYALYERVWDSIMQLTDEQYKQGVDYSHGSVHNQMLHVANVDARWLRGLQEDPNARAFALDPADFATREKGRETWNQNVQAFKDYVASLEETDLMKVPQGMGGPTWQVLIHVANHGTDHRGQILRILHDLGASTFDQDLIFHLWFS